jgi:hypothetical protein
MRAKTGTTIHGKLACASSACKRSTERRWNEDLDGLFGVHDQFLRDMVCIDSLGWVVWMRWSEGARTPCWPWSHADDVLGIGIDLGLEDGRDCIYKGAPKCSRRFARALSCRARSWWPRAASLYLNEGEAGHITRARALVTTEGSMWSKVHSNSHSNYPFTTMYSRWNWTKDQEVLYF